MKSEKKLFKLSKDKKVKIKYYNKSFVANGGPLGLRVGKNFYKYYLKKEQEAVIWHELYHCKFIVWSILRICNWIKTGFNEKKVKWIEEFNADKYAAQNCGKDNVLKILKKAKILYEKKIEKYNPKTHPPIKERIKRIKNLT